jgi:uncharacterized protein (DUF488 family)
MKRSTKNKENDIRRARIYAIGHSTHPLDHFIKLVKAHGIHMVCDVRTVPRSRHVPQFNKDSLETALPAQGLGYRHFPQLGGLRKPSRNSVNLGWRNASFRGFADYMQTDQFKDGLQKLIELSEEEGPVVMMCAEALPWRCHRSLIADALLAQGIHALQLDNRGHATPHTLTSFASVKDGKVTYPGVI